MRVAVKHGFYEEADAYEEKTWQQLAEICNAASVRILGGQLEKDKDPLIGALEGICTTNTILWQEDHPHPVCLLGKIGRLTGETAAQKRTPCKKINSMGIIPAVAVKHANVKIPGVFKCMLGIQGSDCIRSEGKKKERYDRKYNHQDNRSHREKRRDDTLDDPDLAEL